MKLLRFFLFLICILSVNSNVFATHNRAGEITFEWIGVNLIDLKYKITIVTYTKRSSAIDRPTLDNVNLGDGTLVTFPRISTVQVDDDINRNVYEFIHTYSGNGTFPISFEDPNRNSGVINIPNSVDVPFYVVSELVINPYLGPNSSPVLSYPPIDRGCIGKIFIHNPAAHDPEGDSLSYVLVACGGGGGTSIPGYTFPNASNSFTLNQYTGDLIWDSPVSRGEYNVAFNIYQYKQGIYAGFVRRDMQIVIGDCTNNPPVIQAVNDTCVLAGDTLRFDVTAIDPDQDIVHITGYGGVYIDSIVANPATLTNVTVGNNDTVTTRFMWATECSDVRFSSYTALFRAQDVQPNDSTSLVDIKTVNIRVIAPAPPFLNVNPNGNSILLNWGMSPCANAIGYYVYRRINQYGGVLECPCDNGVPSYTGYELIATIHDVDSLEFLDSNNGSGLSIGVQYCYLVTAFFSDGSESCASPQSCASLKKDLPVITNVDVNSTDVVNGSINVIWSKPTELDTIQYPGPYEYRVFHSTGFNGAAFSQFAVMTNLNDTVVVDTLINTTGPWSYKVDLYYTNNGTLTFKGSSSTASSVFLTVTGSDNSCSLTWSEQVPWTNSSYEVYRFNPLTSLYELQNTVTTQSYLDTLLDNGTQYCYYVRSIGSYSTPGIDSLLYNRSEKACATPIDNVPPCATALNVISDCAANSNFLSWVNPNHTCADDVLKYYIYYSPIDSLTFELIDSVLNANDTTYLHSNLQIIAGCYKVTAIDSVGNETVNPLVVCVDTCRQYVLPSVFTPNNDGVNDLFHPCDQTTSADLQAKNCPAYKNVKSVDIKIYNRWGNLVYETTDKDVNWDGKNKDSKQDCPEGVYFYTCKVYFYRILGDGAEELHGTIQLIRNK